MTNINPVTELEIIDGDKKYTVEAKATFFFDQKAKDFSEEKEEANGKKTTTPGFEVIFNKILFADQAALLDYWECALAYLGKDAPTREQISDALLKIINEKEDTLELLQGALDVMNNSGFFKRKARQFWMQINYYGTKVSEEEGKSDMQAGLKLLKESYKGIMGAEPY
ncbi:hypothetical protein RN70_09725 [Staphylococcus schleiferi]|uniref:tail assembly chaperone n=1 Tax=Staphylococcus coagulans TaxID=74706 RepID=UPI000679F169|nr:hypothetical protein NP71_09465 [Staphylococcus schleiferi]AKS74158.1 hypothetical protein RN70_09725 [Staphylococcus schleiferi]